jgi:hypothetical protein
MSRSPEAYLHTPTAYQTDLSCEAHDVGTHATGYVTNVKRTKSILLSKGNLCLYIHESLERYGTPWKLTIANTSGGRE